MTEREERRFVQALACDWNDRASVVSAFTGLQSTDDPVLVPLYQKVGDRLDELDREGPSPRKPGDLVTRILDSFARTIEEHVCADGDKEGPADGFTCGNCAEGMGCERPTLAQLVRTSPLFRRVIAAVVAG